MHLTIKFMLNLTITHILAQLKNIPFSAKTSCRLFRIDVRATYKLLSLNRFLVPKRLLCRVVTTIPDRSHDFIKQQLLLSRLTKCPY